MPRPRGSGRSCAPRPVRFPAGARPGPQPPRGPATLTPRSPPFDTRAVSTAPADGGHAPPPEKRHPARLTREVVEGGGDVLGGVAVGGVAHHQAGLAYRAVADKHALDAAPLGTARAPPAPRSPGPAPPARPALPARRNGRCLAAAGKCGVPLLRGHRCAGSGVQARASRARPDRPSVPEPSGREELSATAVAARPAPESSASRPHAPRQRRPGRVPAPGSGGATWLCSARSEDCGPSAVEPERSVSSRLPGDTTRGGRAGRGKRRVRPGRCVPALRPQRPPPARRAPAPGPEAVLRRAGGECGRRLRARIPAAGR